MLNHHGQISNLVKAAKGPVCVSAVISYSQTSDAIDNTDSDNLATEL